MKRLNIFATEFEHDDDDPEGYSSDTCVIS